jgi:uncharacterized protein YjiS (DUF1127 family)
MIFWRPVIERDRDRRTGNLFGRGATPSPIAPNPAPALVKRKEVCSAASAGCCSAFSKAGMATSSTLGSAPDRTSRSRLISYIRHWASSRQAVDNLSRLTGVAAPDLLSELARVLPGVINRLTPQGRMPNQAEMSRW